MPSATAPTILLLLLLSYYNPPLSSSANPSNLKISFLNAFVVYIQVRVTAARVNPFTPKAYVTRYWEKRISNNLTKPSFLLDKASPLTATDYAAFSRRADQNSLSTQLPDFCAKADLLCFSDLAPSLEKHSQDVNFANYVFDNFTNYGTKRRGGVDSFTQYVVEDTFRRYSRGSTDHDDKFTVYANDSSVIDDRFNTYGTAATGGKGEFNNYNTEVNVPGARFTSYSDRSNARKQSFIQYSNQANAGDQSFTSYGKKGNNSGNEFKSYGDDLTNVIGSTFTNYGETGNAPKDTFTSYGNSSNVPRNSFSNYGAESRTPNDTFTTYGSNANVPENNFKNYGSESSKPVVSFKNYRDNGNVGDDNFQSYAKKSNAGKVDFLNYAQTFNEGTDTFSGYGKNAADPVTVGFKIYGINNTFKDYEKRGVTFSSYTNDSSSVVSSLVSRDKKVHSRVIEPGKFFRDEMLKSGTIMPMPDIQDKMPKRSFLPRTILSKLPFSTSKLAEMKRLYHASDDSGVVNIMIESLKDCEREPSPGEVKRCVASIEDMIDFATSVLGRNVTVRSTENIQGSKGDIMIGEVKEINGGKVTKSLSCHQSLYFYMIYYCHSVPKVRVYEADILDPKSRVKINHGVAVCHLDTSSWSQGHGAFIALGSKPGKIEVCHWIFQNDLTWTTAY
ncbi:LOW QUALITY PROTEIN: polygalacturonase 1 beta-like protein 3 [Primulina tabacum]|uniref:LOW QUALITY PROTEIN: polygalacturonase 1 beta-like protein 3 n=1 Tax=Primulina tabacum TaxID=48773 RepID=UPI003F59F94C